VKYARTLAVKKVPGEGLRIVQEKKRKAR
jgi:hypothetical protein